jgi:hypothetical protein
LSASDTHQNGLMGIAAIRAFTPVFDGLRHLDPPCAFPLMGFAPLNPSYVPFP